jgi:hypothetical protein
MGGPSTGWSQRLSCFYPSARSSAGALCGLGHKEYGGVKMKRICRLIFILIPFLMLGCPLTSKFPLGDSRSAPMDQRYIGKWVSTKSTDNDVLNIWILPFNENEYYIEATGDTKDEVARYRSYLTVIDNIHILNVQPITVEKNEIVYMGDREYIFVKISLSDNNILTLWNVENNWVKKDHSKEELFQYVHKNIKNDNVYDKLDAFKRKLQ